MRTRKSRLNKFPPEGFAGGVIKFLLAGLFGLFVTVALCLVALYWLFWDELWHPWTLAILIGLPLVWGVLGIFWFEPVIKMQAQSSISGVEKKNKIFSTFLSQIKQRSSSLLKRLANQHDSSNTLKALTSLT